MIRTSLTLSLLLTRASETDAKKPIRGKRPLYLKNVLIITFPLHDVWRYRLYFLSPRISFSLMAFRAA